LYRVLGYRGRAVFTVGDHYRDQQLTMSTRKLIIAAMLCGMAILVAFAIQVVLAT
jgi:hypothetical protein